MTNPILVVTTRGPILENRHRGAAAIMDSSGEIVGSWGDIDSAILPRSSIKMIQALPLVESGAAEAAGLTSEHLALACASHQGSPMHTERVASWLTNIGMDEGALLCGPQPPRDPAVKAVSRKASRILNNCSGKHTGFLTLSRHLGAEPTGYLDPSAPVQSAVAQAFAEITETEAPLRYGIDGCSAPNFAASLTGLAGAMALFADPTRLNGTRSKAARIMVDAMRAHPLLISGEGRACAALIGACGGHVVVKTGADGVFTGIVPEKKLGFCLKIDDGDTKAAEALCAGLLIHVGALDANHPAAKRYANTEIRNFNDELVGQRQVTLD